MIFNTEAPKYWAAGLPAIPLMFEEKRPAINRWQLFADTFPTLEEQQEWLSKYPNGNIGLPTGPSSGLVAFDVDTTDPEILKVLDRIVPYSPWVRVGAKGSIKVFRFNGERTTRIKNAADGGMICEILSKGTQFVLPPSIHPSTKAPYTANCELIDVHKSLPMLPDKFETIIRDALREAGIEVSIGANNKITTFVPAGARDNTMVWHAGLLARAVLRGERSLLQALGEMESWVGSFMEQVVGDAVTAEKGQKKLVEFLIKDVTGEGRKALPEGWDEGLTDEDKEKLGLSFTEDDVQWNRDKILEYVMAEFERFPEYRDAGRMNAVNVALDRIVRGRGVINDLDEGMILRYIATQSAGTITVSNLNKQLSSLRKGGISGENHKELAVATLQFLGQYGEVRFDGGNFWQWRGALWSKMQEFEILRVIAEQYGDMPAGRRQADHSGILKVMRSLANKPLRSYEIRGLNFANGFLTEKLQLVAHDPNHGMTYILPYRYMPELAGHMPMFNQYLADSWGDDPDYGDKLLALQEAMGATLMSSASIFQRAICLFGQPGSGKSRMTSIMRGLLPENSVASIPPSEWKDKFLPAGMFGKLLNFAGELSESKSIPGDIFKQIVEGEEVTAQHKGMNPFAFRPTCAQWFSSNHLPKTKDSSDGFNRRWLFLEWNKRVPLHKIIPDLDRIILEGEREAIVAWAVLGFQRLVENGGYTIPTSHLVLLDQMAIDNNSVRYFLTTSARVVVGEHRMRPGGDRNFITATDLHAEYWAFCIATSTSHRVPLNQFVKMMKEMQPLMGFKERTQVTKHGHPEIVYDHITLADGVRSKGSMAA